MRNILRSRTFSCLTQILCAAWLLSPLPWESSRMAQAASSPPTSLPAPDIAVRGSVVTLTFSVPKKPAGIILQLSVDRGRLLGRYIRPGHPLVVCVGRLSPGPHRLGFELAGRDQIVHTDEVAIHVEVPGGSPFSCPPVRRGS